MAKFRLNLLVYATAIVRFFHRRKLRGKLAEQAHFDVLGFDVGNHFLTEVRDLTLDKLFSTP